MTLSVHQAGEDDVYQDIIRVHKDRRNGVREGRICHVSVGDAAALFAMRGLPDSQKDWVRLDEFGRDRLGIADGASCEFTFREASYPEALCWACRAADPGARIAAWVAVWGLALGAFGLLVGGLGVWLALRASC